MECKRDWDMNMVHYPVFAEPFVLVVIRGALDKA